MKISEEQYLAHYGILRKSGRYPWGSGENPYQRNKMFLDTVAERRAEGMSDVEIARAYGLTTTQLRATASIARNEKRAADIAMAQRLKDKGWSTTAISRRMEMPEPTVRNLLKPGAKDRADTLVATSDMLKRQADEKKFLDVGSGVEQYVGVSRDKLKVALARLKEEGYEVHKVNIEQLGTGQYTTVQVLVPPGTTYGELIKNKYNIKQVAEYSEDGGRTFLGIEPPKPIESKRVKVNYAEDGGDQADGVIYVRPGVEDVSLGGANYAQVRINVDGTHYLKGMAVYKDDLPDGVDLAFNTNKKRSEVANDLEAMKPLKDDPDNPFGAVIKPGGQRGVMNIVNEEGDWGAWSRTISTQVLSKQDPRLAKSQLSMTLERKQNELEEIMSLTNPVVKKKLLETFADSADSAAVHLKAAALPRQTTQVILPVNSLKDNEVFAPNYKNGERVVLIRYPHGGVFEIPELKVNNKNSEGKKTVGVNARDAVGINSRVAERLSGADFDGDFVLVIPNDGGKIKTAPALEELKNFDPKRAYPKYEGMKPMTPASKQQKMGEVSNLITDMTIKGASSSEIARAVRHSMVVIDAEKHELNYRQSAIDNGISQLKEKYQGGSRKGASTLISRATSQKRVPMRTRRPAAEGGPIDPETGKRVWKYTGERTKSGELKTFRSTQLAETDDASTLSSGTPIEEVYVKHSNSLKAMANQARREYLRTKPRPYSKSAREAYQGEVDTLDAKLSIALRNAPLERQAQIIANSVVAAKRRAKPDMEPAEVKKLKGQALVEARTRTGASKQRIEITDKEWEAIQAGAISNHKLGRILENADLDRVKELATPRDRATVSPAMASRARTMASSGYTQAEIASALGVSASTVNDVLSEGG